MSLHPAATPDQHPHTYKLRVYYEDTDAGGIVYHASYLRFAERARTEALRSRGVPHAGLVEEHGLLFVVRRVQLDYLQPARLDDELSITTETRAVGGASATLRQSFRCADRDVAVLEVLLVCVGVADGRPARIPDRWRNALAMGLNGGQTR